MTANLSECGLNSQVDAFLRREQKWRAEFEVLRAVVLKCGLTEELKWGQPCYSSQGVNVVLMHGFKDYCALLFMRGALLKDPNGILIQQTKNVQSARQIRFTDSGEISQLEPVLIAYVHEAIDLARTGARVVKKSTAEFPVAEEFRQTLSDDPALKAAFDALTPGRQRGYLLYFASAKQAKTRQARVQKSAPLILEGKGLND